MMGFLKTFLAAMLAIVVTLLIVVGAVAIKAMQKPDIEKRSWLVVDLYGEIQEYDPPSSGILDQVMGGGPETLQRILDNMAKAAVDDRIAGVIVKVAGCTAGGGMREEIRGAIKAVRAAGKPVYGWSDSADKGVFYVAAACDSVFMPPTAYISFLGYAMTVPHVRGTLDKLGVEPRLHKIKDYKSAAEVVMDKELSPAARENEEWILADVWAEMMNVLSEDRGLTEDEVTGLMEEAAFGAARALEAGLIDGILYWDELADRLKGEDDDDLRTVSMGRYADVDFDDLDMTGDAKIAVVHAQGTIGGRQSGVNPLLGMMMGHESVCADLRRAREDEDVAAVVFRVNSGGGDALTSDLIGHEVEITAAVKPVIVSMVDVAASGGYHIAYRATRIVADGNTIAGSIGSISGKFVAKGLYDKLGITHSFVTRGPNALMWSDVYDFTDEQWEIHAARHWADFNDWLRDVAERRGMSFAEAEKLAHGRVWTGRQAAGNGLVDEVGGLDRAVVLACELAEVPADEKITVVHYPESKDFLESLLSGEGDMAMAARWLVYRALREDVAGTWNMVANNPRWYVEELRVR